jgi:signal transduction histidine kinase
MKSSKFFKRFYSLRFLVFLLVLLAGVVPLTILEITLYDNISTTLLGSRESDLKNQTRIMANQLVTAGYLYNSSSSTSLTSEMKQMATDYDGRIMITDASFMVISDTLQINTGRYLIDERVLAAFDDVSTCYSDKEQESMTLVMPIQSTSDQKILGVIIVTTSIQQQLAKIEVLKNKLALLTVMLVVVLLVLALVSSYIVTVPFRRLKESVKQVSNGTASALTPVGYSELTEIIITFNNILAQLKKVDESRQEFVSNVSHELKTPITSIRVLADSLMTMEDAPIELYKEFMQDISSEIDRESKIISDLLALVKMDKSAASLNIATVDMNQLINDILHRLLPIANQRGVELVLESFRPVTAEVDETKLTLAISNLVENAIKYNVDNGYVHVSLNADHKYMYIKVQDSGIGIPEDCQDLIFDRFYRVDKARSRETGGTGLGLAITKSVIQMHNGAIRVYSKPNEGTTFSVRIPLNYKE